MRAKAVRRPLFEYRELGRLRDVEARLALIKSAATLGIKFSRDAAHELVRLSAGYPYFVRNTAWSRGTQQSDRPSTWPRLSTLPKPRAH
jgi:hypothetical protein